MLNDRAADSVRAALVYDDNARRFLLRAKLGDQRELFRLMGIQLALSIARSEIFRNCTVLVPAPSHPWFNLKRGFSPAREIARPISRRFGLRSQNSILSIRATSRFSSKRLGSSARWSSTSRAIRVHARLDKARVLLVDDVMTSGATVESCAAALKAAGAREVRVAVWARALPGARYHRSL